MPSTSQVFRRAQATDSVATTFAAKNTTTTQPSGDGVIDMFSREYGLHGPPDNSVSKFVQLLPFGTNADNETFDMQLWGWSRMPNVTDGGLTIWVPQLLLELNVVLSAATATSIAASTFLADTILIAKGDLDAQDISPANDFAASVICHMRGSELLEFDFDLGTAAGANCLWRVMDQ